MTDAGTDRPNYTSLPALIARLRARDGCPWDREQTHTSLRPYLLEETYEAIDAIDDGDVGRLAGELGDLFLQVLLHAQIASEEGRFDIDEVSRRLADKIIRRHPHVFGDEAYAGADHITRWEQLKRSEPESAKSVLAGLPASLPALFMAERLLERAGRVKVQPPLDTKAESVGERLFALVADARKKRLDPEQELRAVNRRFAARFERFEALAKRSGRELETLTPNEVEDLWRRAE